MDKLRNILNDILNVYNSNYSNEDKFNKVTELWTNYYKLSSELDMELDEAYNIYLMCENECYKIDEKPIIKKIDEEKVFLVIKHLKEVLSNKNDGISIDEAFILLDYIVSNVRKKFQSLGIDIKNNSLNGYCELGQVLSIKPFEELGLSVTKNSASDLGYHLNHCFGTVCFPIKEDNNIELKYFLIDTTYRQFFSSVRCNYGRYYVRDEDIGIMANPSPGYFVNDLEFARKLLSKGYIELDSNTAYLYGNPFYLSSLGKDNVKDNNIDYYSIILNSNRDYSYEELDELNIELPSYNSNKTR